MDKPFSFDRSLLIPIGVAVFSLVGLCGVLAAGRFTAMRGRVEEVPTATPFKYSFIGTEPAIVVPTANESGVAPTEPTAILNTPILLSTEGNESATLIVLGTATRTPTAGQLSTGTPATGTALPSRTPTSASMAPLNPGTYDDLDNRFLYSGNWTTQSAVSGAYQNTLHVSGTVGNSLTFRFIGQELRLFFQAGPSLGTIRLELDGTNYDMNESNSSTQLYEWVLPTVSNGTHTVKITHIDGGSVNLDYIIIPEPPTTPTNTATATP